MKKKTFKRNGRVYKQDMSAISKKGVEARRIENRLRKEFLSLPKISRAYERFRRERTLIYAYKTNT